jgi:uncharacterized protein
MIFVDTSAWLALGDRHDRDHTRTLDVARRIARGEFGKQVTTNYVTTETLTLVRRRLGLSAAISLAKTFAESDEIRVFWIERVHHEEAMQLMAAHTDKVWSLTDCTSFVVMHALEIRQAFALDDDFAQAGFSVVP